MPQAINFVSPVAYSKPVRFVTCDCTARKLVRVARSSLLKFAFEAIPSADLTAVLRLASGIHVAGSGIGSGILTGTVCEVAAVFGLFAASVATSAATLIATVPLAVGVIVAL